MQASLLGEAVDAADIAILVSDEDGRCIAVNQRACDLLGYSRDELLRLRVTDVAQHEDARGDFEAMIARGELKGRTTVVRKDGSELNLRHRSSETTIASLPYYVAVLWPEP